MMEVCAALANFRAYKRNVMIYQLYETTLWESVKDMHK